MKLKIAFNTDPTLRRVILIAILLLAETLLIGLGVIFGQNRMPTETEFYGILSLAGLQFVTYILTFLKKEEEAS